MSECFIVFSEVIAFVCISSQFAAVRTSLPSQRWIGADAASPGANKVEEVSISRSVSLTSYQGVTDEWELSSPPQRRGLLLDGQAKLLPALQPSTHSAPCGRRGQLLSGGTQEPGQAADSLLVAFVGANRLFAGLLLQQVRPHGRSPAAPKQKISSSRNRIRGAALVRTPAAGSAFTPGSERPVTTAQDASPGLPLAGIETLLAELVRRRLRSLAAKESAQ